LPLPFKQISLALREHPHKAFESNQAFFFFFFFERERERKKKSGKKVSGKKIGPWSNKKTNTFKVQFQTGREVQVFIGKFETAWALH
jgi:hypothetical protein